jgi:hypothetical protein
VSAPRAAGAQAGSTGSATAGTAQKNTTLQVVEAPADLAGSINMLHGRACAARQSANVVDMADGVVEGKAWPLVPDAEYLATYIGHRCVEIPQFKGQAKLFIDLRLHDAGEHSGKVLFRAYRVRRRIDGRRFVVAPRSALLKMVCRVLDHRARPDRITLRPLKGCLLRIRTRTVTKDSEPRELPAALRYSVVADILGKETA